MAKILVVDDEEQIRVMVRDILETDGHEVLLAASGVEGYELAKSSECDLIITDLVMPEKTGIDLIMDVRKVKPALKVVAISGGGGITKQFDYLPVARLVGAFVVLKKPFYINDLRHAVDEALAA